MISNSKITAYTFPLLQALYEAPYRQDLLICPTALMYVF